MNTKAQVWCSVMHSQHRAVRTDHRKRWICSAGMEREWCLLHHYTSKLAVKAKGLPVFSIPLRWL